MSAITVRPATLDDLPAILPMARRFVASYGAGLTENLAQLTGLATHLITNPACTLLVAETHHGLCGFIGLVGYAHHVSGVPTVGEVAWWVEPAARGSGLALLDAAEQWATAYGAQHLLMIAPNERVGSLYTRRGYRAVETTYQRALVPAHVEPEPLEDAS